MKHSFLVALVGMAVLSTPVTAQSAFGLVGGLVSADAELASEGISVSFDNRSGFALGLSMQHHLSAVLSFVPEAMYVTKGFELESDGDAFGLGLGYLEVPLLVRAAFGAAGAATRPWVTAGPVVAFKLSCNAATTTDGVEVEADCTELDEEEDPAEFRSIDFGMMFGAGVDFGRFGVSVRYDLGLANILDTTEDVSYRNRALMLLGSVKFQQ